MKTRIITISLLLIFSMFATGCSDHHDTNHKDQKGDETSMDQFAGTWHGSIKVPNQPLPIILSFEKNEPKGTISIPVQGIKDYPLSKVTTHQSGISFEADIQGQHIAFDGKGKNDKIQGTFTQNGQSFPFELQKGTDKEKTTEQTKEKEGQFLSVETNKGKL